MSAEPGGAGQVLPDVDASQTGGDLEARRFTAKLHAAVALQGSSQGLEAEGLHRQPRPGDAQARRQVRDVPVPEAFPWQR